jgi:hypothetical protein
MGSFFDFTKAGDIILGMKWLGDCMDFWSFVIERALVRVRICPKKILSQIVVNLQGYGIICLYGRILFNEKWGHLTVWMEFICRRLNKEVLNR